MNDSVMNNLSTIKNSPFQILWQTGKNYYDQILSKKDIIPSNIIFFPFIKEMNYAYASSDIIISRAGALAISELCVIGKPSCISSFSQCCRRSSNKKCYIFKICRCL